MDNFFLDKEGVWFLPLKAGEDPPTPIWVCSPLKILAITRDHDNENHGKLLRFIDYDGNELRWTQSTEQLFRSKLFASPFLCSFF